MTKKKFWWQFWILKKWHFNGTTRCLKALKFSTFCCSGLRERDRFSRTTTPVCVLYIKSRGSRTWKEVGRTEKIENSLDPEWTKTFEIEYFFEEKQVSRYVQKAILLFSYYCLKHLFSLLTKRLKFISLQLITTFNRTYFKEWLISFN